MDFLLLFPYLLGEIFIRAFQFRVSSGGFVQRVRLFSEIPVNCRRDRRRANAKETPPGLDFRRQVSLGVYHWTLALESLGDFNCPGPAFLSFVFMLIVP